MLKQYYQQTDKLESSTSPSNSQESDNFKRADPLDIGKAALLQKDTSAFHPELALNKVLKEQNLVELISNHNSLTNGFNIF